MSAANDIFIKTFSLPEASSPEIEAAWKREALDRCKAFDEGRLTERAEADVLNDVFSRRPEGWKDRLS
jgi:hypothetical protein